MKIFRLRPDLFSLLFFSIIITSSSSVRAASGDQYWDSKFGIPGVTNTTLTLVAQNGTLYQGGYSAAVLTNSALNYWDGFQWETLGTFNAGAGIAIIYATAFVGNTLYVGGGFTSVNGVPANGLAAWNGSNWSSVGFSGTVVTLAASGNNLYVGGQFTGMASGGLMMTNIGYWDGSTWHAMGNGLGTSSSAVESLLVNGGSVYAGGVFANSGSVAVTDLAAWNGSAWQAVNNSINGTVYALGYNGGNLYVGGKFTAPESYLAEWNGASWSAVGGGVNGSIGGIQLFNNQICVSGGFTQAGGITCSNFAIWNGSTWSAASTGLNAQVACMYSTGTNVYVGGSFGLAGNTYVNGLASWDGSHWNPVGTPGRTNGLIFVVSSMGTDGKNVYAGGQFNYAGLINANSIARFDGQKWNSLGTGLGPASALPSVYTIATTNNNIYVGGTFSTAGGVSVANIAQWDGTNWYALGNPGGQIFGIAVQPGGVYAVGAAKGASLYGSPFFEVWNGSSWNNVLVVPPAPENGYCAVPFNTPAPAMDAIATMGTNIFVGGSFSIGTFNPPQGSQGILRYDGTYCYSVGSGFNSNVVALAVINTNLYAAGNFTNADGYWANQIAMWNGMNWTNVGGGVIGSGTVYSLGTMGNYLFAGGSFTNIGGVTASGIAEWDGTYWYALGSGVAYPGGGGYVSAMTSIGTDLYAGGLFRFAGGKPSYYAGHWNNHVNFNTPQLSNPAKKSPGHVAMTLTGINGLTNIIFATTNFASWTPVFTNTAGICTYTDSAAASYPHRYYRATNSP